MTPRQVTKVVRYVCAQLGSCEHSSFADCGRCIGRWIRKGIKQAERMGDKKENR